MSSDLRTDRLLLRRWREDDRAAFAAMNADPAVMEFFVGLQSREESDELVDRIERSFEDNGFGLWAVEVPGVAPFIGFVGLMIPPFEAHFTPAVEVGWRLAAEFWHAGYATEGATAALAFGFTEAGLDAVVSFTTHNNLPSRRVMERIDMTHDPGDDFVHPRIAADHPLQPFVLYREPRPSPAGVRR